MSFSKLIAEMTGRTLKFSIRFNGVENATPKPTPIRAANVRCKERMGFVAAATLTPSGRLSSVRTTLSAACSQPAHIVLGTNGHTSREMTLLLVAISVAAPEAKVWYGDKITLESGGGDEYVLFVGTCPSSECVHDTMSMAGVADMLLVNNKDKVRAA